jgi:hypothetical protein
MSHEYAFVARDVRRIVLTAGLMVAILAILAILGIIAWRIAMPIRRRRR